MRNTPPPVTGQKQAQCLTHTPAVETRGQPNTVWSDVVIIWINRILEILVDISMIQFIRFSLYTRDTVPAIESVTKKMLVILSGYEKANTWLQRSIRVSRILIYQISTFRASTVFEAAHGSHSVRTCFIRKSNGKWKTESVQDVLHQQCWKCFP